MDKEARIAVKFGWRKPSDLIAAQKLATELPDIAIYHCQQGGKKLWKVSLFCTIKILRHITLLVREASTYEPEFTTSLKEAGYLSQYNQT